MKGVVAWKSCGGLEHHLHLQHPPWGQILQILSSSVRRKQMSGQSEKESTASSQEVQTDFELLPLLYFFLSRLYEHYGNIRNITFQEYCGGKPLRLFFKCKIKISSNGEITLKYLYHKERCKVNFKFLYQLIIWYFSVEAFHDFVQNLLCKCSIPAMEN